MLPCTFIAIQLIIVPWLFRGSKLKWKGSYLVALLMSTIQFFNWFLVAISWVWISNGTIYCDMADERCRHDEFQRLYKGTGITMFVLLLVLFAKITVWDSLASLKQPIRNSAGYVLVVAVLTLGFPFACAVLMHIVHYLWARAKCLARSAAPLVSLPHHGIPRE
jgi:hypothetical protein